MPELYVFTKIPDPNGEVPAVREVEIPEGYRSVAAYTWTDYLVTVCAPISSEGRSPQDAAMDFIGKLDPSDVARATEALARVGAAVEALVKAATERVPPAG